MSIFASSGVHQDYTDHSIVVMKEEVVVTLIAVIKNSTPFFFKAVLGRLLSFAGITTIIY